MIEYIKSIERREGKKKKEENLKKFKISSGRELKDFIYEICSDGKAEKEMNGEIQKKEKKEQEKENKFH